MTIKETSVTVHNRPIFRVLSLFLIGFFLVMTLLTMFVLIPRINQSFERQYVRDGEATLEVETELFKRFVENHRAILQDLANFPVVTSAALLSQSNNPSFIDLVDNFSIFGEKNRLVLQDIVGDIIYQTEGNIKGKFLPNEPWVQSILNGDIPFNFKLLEQEGSLFRFILSIPITYHENIEGILSAEITTHLDKVLGPRTQEEGSGFVLKQGDVIVKTDVSLIEFPHEFKAYLADQNVDLSYIGDYKKVISEQNDLRDSTLVILFFGLAISFMLFSVLAYRMLMKTEEETFHWNIFSKLYIVPLIIAGIGISASISAYFIIQNLKHQQVRQEILAVNNLQIQSIEKALISKANTLNSLKAFFDASEHINRADFKIFSAPFLKEHQDIHALEWVPKVEGDQREYYEKLARAEGFNDYTIKEANSEGVLKAAPLRDVYFPVYYAEPLEANKKILGLDSPLNLRRVEAIKKATDTGHITAAGTFPLLQDKQRKTGLLIFNPVYSHSPNYMTVQKRQNHLKGFVLLVLRVDDVVNATLNKVNGDTIISIEDVTNPLKSESIFGPVSQETVNSEFSSESVIEIFGRRWKIKSCPNPSAYVNTTPFLPWIVLLIGIIFTVFVTYTFIQLTRRTAVIRKIVEKQTYDLAEERKFSELVINAIPDLIFVKDESFKIVKANKSFLDIFPVSKRNKIIGHTTVENFSAEEADLFLTEDRRAFDLGYSRAYETLKLGNGKVINIDTMKVRFEDMNNKRYILGIARDVSELHKVKENLENTVEDRTKELKAANETKDMFLANMSHELRTPLNSIIGLVRILMQEEDLSNDHVSTLGIVDQSSTSLLEIVNDILDISKIEAGKIELENLPFNVADLTSSILNQLRPLTSKNGLDLRNNEAEIPATHVLGDEFRLSRIILNLASNAIKYTNEGYVEVLTVVEEIDDENIEYKCIITDTGIGIPEDKIEFIFDKFTQAEESTERRFGGTGLGLNITQHLVSLMGGDIKVESEHGKGSVFTVSLILKKTEMPIQLEKKELSVEGELQNSGNERKLIHEARILVAEDHELNQIFIMKLLKRVGFNNIDIVADGKKAFKAYQDNDYDFILMDCHMPEMNGYETTKAIRKEEDDQKSNKYGMRIPIVAVTADAMVGTKDICIEAGMDNYITKPIMEDEFRALMAEWFE
jgi:PAS domain S-box-containing protein